MDSRDGGCPVKKEGRKVFEIGQVRVDRREVKRNGRWLEGKRKGKVN